MVGGEPCKHLAKPSKTEVLPTILHRSELLAAGLTNDEIRTALRSGKWRTLHRGTYGDAASIAPLHADTRYELRARAVAARSPHLVLSHISAAAVLQLPISGTKLDAVHLTRIGKGGGRSGPGRTVHSAHLQPREILSGKGFRVTDVARTLINVACTESFATTTIAADYALYRRKPMQPGQSAEDVVIAEKVREDLIPPLGYVVVRFAWAELSNPSAIVAKINAAIVRGRSVVDAGGITGS